MIPPHGRITRASRPPRFAIRHLLPVLIMVVMALGLTPFLVVSAAFGTELPTNLTAGGSGVVKDVPSGDTVVLQDGRLVRLAGVQAPKMAPSRGRGRKAPLADEARSALERLVLGRTVSLWFGTTRIDRHERVLAQLVRDDGLWLQAELLDQGWVRAYPLPDHHPVMTTLLSAEAPARDARRGIWGHSFYGIRSPDGLGHDIDTFQIVEGRVLTAVLAKSQLYLNFGPDWHTDFTIRVPRRAMRAFRQTWGDGRRFQGQLVRVRGWVYRHNGPEIEITVPEQLEPVAPNPSPNPAANAVPTASSVPAPVPSPPLPGPGPAPTPVP